MCGIWGLIPGVKNGFTKHHLDLYKQMMQITALRGVHSTGIYAVGNKDSKPKVAKTVGDPYNYLHVEKVSEPIDNFLFAQGYAAVGHGRFATVGNITVKNAHPFTHNHFTLVHNGTIRNGLSEHGKNSEVEVDSHALCIKIAKVGIEAALKEVDGAYALIMYDEEKRGLFIARNSQRPLFYATSRSAGTLIMSEREALEFLITRNRLTGFTVESLVPEKVFHIDLETGSLVEGVSVAPERRHHTVPSMWNHEHGYGAKWSVYRENDSRINAITPIRQIAVTPERRTAPKQETTFLVESMEKTEATYKYYGIAEDQSEVVFFSGREIPEHVGRIGRAAIQSSLYKEGKLTHFVKHREIEWLDEKPEKKIVTALGLVLTQSEWEDLCATRTCSSCNSRINENDYADTLVKQNGKVVCRVCLDGAADSGISARTVESMQ